MIKFTKGSDTTDGLRANDDHRHHFHSSNVAQNYVMVRSGIVDWFTGAAGCWARGLARPTGKAKNLPHPASRELRSARRWAMKKEDPDAQGVSYSM